MYINSWLYFDACIPRKSFFAGASEVSIYSRVFRIVSCDAFTKFFYEEGGLDVGIEEPAPLDTFAETQVASAAPDGVSSATRGV